VSQSRQARGAVRRLLSVALILVVCGCDRHTSTGSTPSALTIRGRALDFRTNAGVPGAVIEFAARFQSGGRPCVFGCHGVVRDVVARSWFL
jgi:hypothetical protein